MIAHQCDLEPGEFIWTGGDCHIYLNHLAQVEEQLTREPLDRPRLTFRTRPPTLFDYRYEDIELIDYKAHPPISAPVAV